MRLRSTLPNSTRLACAISQAPQTPPPERSLLPPPAIGGASLAEPGRAGPGEAMLAWKEKVADRLARLLADSPPSPAAVAAAPIEAPQVRSVSLLGAPLFDASHASSRSHCACAGQISAYFTIPISVWIRWLVRGSRDYAVVLLVPVIVGDWQRRDLEGLARIDPDLRIDFSLL
jgi:hypothetical protein